MSRLPFAEELFSRYRPLWNRIAYQYLRNPQDAQDAIQEACRKFLDADKEWNTLEDAKRYYGAILVNTCVDFYHCSRKRREEPLEENGRGELPDQGWSRNADPGKWEQEESILQYSVEAITHLPDDQRQVIERLLLAENPTTLTELSRELQIPISTLKSRFTAGLEKVKNTLRKKRLL